MNKLYQIMKLAATYQVPKLLEMGCYNVSYVENGYIYVYAHYSKLGMLLEYSHRDNDHVYYHWTYGKFSLYASSKTNQEGQDGT